MFRIFVLLAWKIYLLTNCVKSTDKIVALHPQKEHNPSFFHWSMRQSEYKKGSHFSWIHKFMILAFQVN